MIRLRTSFAALTTICFLWSGIGNAWSQEVLSIALAWDANTETNLAGYRLYWGTAPRVYTSSATIGNETTNIVSALQLGQTYFFALTAYNTGGRESDFSNEVKFLPSAYGRAREALAHLRPHAEESGQIPAAVRAIDPGLVAAFSFNEGSGTIVEDASGNGHIGTIQGATWTTGRFGHALDFNGAGALVTINNSDWLDLTMGMTLEAWVFPTSTAAFWRDVIYKGWDDIYYLEGSSPVGGKPAVGGTFTSPLYGTDPLELSSWSHLAATYDEANLRLYINGLQVASRAQSGPIATSTEALTIGGNALYGQYWAGRIDEVRIYHRALSASEIQRDMTRPIH